MARKTINFNPEQISNIILLYDVQKISIPKISKIYNVSAKPITKLLIKNNVKIRNTPALTSAQEKEIVYLYKNGKNNNIIAKLYGVDRKTINSCLLKNNIPIKVSKKSILSIPKEERIKITQLYLDGNSVKNIAKLYNVTCRVIEDFLTLNNINVENRFLFTQKQEEKIVSLYNNGTNITILCKLFNIHRRFIQRCLVKNGIKINVKILLTYKQMEEVIMLYVDNGKTLREIGEIYQLSEVTIKNYLFIYNINLRQVNNKQLSKQQIRDIIILFGQGYKIKNIAKVYNTGITVIYKALHNSGITWEQEYSKYDRDEHFFDDIDTREKAYVLGLLYADGNNNGNDISIGLQFGDKEILEKVNELFKSNRPLAFRNNEGKKNIIQGRNCQLQNQYILCIGSVYMCKKAAEWGLVKNKTLKITFPERLKEEFYSDFIRGYFDGDGCIYFNEKKMVLQWSIIGTFNFCSYIKEFLKYKLNINCHLAQSKGSNEVIYTLTVGGNLKINKLMEFIYKDATIWMKRKKDKYINGATKISKHRKWQNETENKKYFTDYYIPN
jgi:transposase